MNRPIGQLRILIVLCLSLAFGGCCHHRACYPQPGFAGVPEAAERSADYALPLAAGDRAELVQFMAASGNRNNLEANPPQPGDLRAAKERYAPVLDRLAQTRPTLDDFQDGAAFVRLFDSTYRPLRVHDARVGRDRGGYFDLGAKEVRGLVSGDYVFAFYLRPLVSIDCPTTNHPAADTWQISPRGPTTGREYSGLTVFHKNFVIPTPTR